MQLGASVTGRRAEIDGLWPALAAAPRFVFFRAFILAGDNFHEQLVVGKLLLGHRTEPLSQPSMVLSRRLASSLMPTSGLFDAYLDSANSRK